MQFLRTLTWREQSIWRGSLLSPLADGLWTPLSCPPAPLGGTWKLLCSPPLEPPPESWQEPRASSPCKSARLLNEITVFCHVRKITSAGIKHLSQSDQDFFSFFCLNGACYVLNCLLLITLKNTRMSQIKCNHGRWHIDQFSCRTEKGEFWTHLPYFECTLVEPESSNRSP